MSPISIRQFLLLYNVFLLIALVVFVLMIARFYQYNSGRKTHYMLFIPALAILAAGVIHDASLDQIHSDILSSLLSCIGGGMLIFLCIQLYRLMMRRKQK